MPSLSETVDIAVASDEQLTPAVLANLLADWQAELNQAALRADAISCMTVEQIRSQNPSLADTLTVLVRNYRFDVIASPIQEIGK